MVMSFDDYDVAGPASGDGGSSEAATSRFELSGPTSLIAQRDVPTALELAIAASPDVAPTIGVDEPTPSSSALKATITAADSTHISASIVAHASGSITFRAHAGDRIQSLDVAITVPPTSGDLDPHFGTSGVVTFESSAQVYALATDADGAIYIGFVRQRLDGADLAVRKITALGAPDPAFGDGGLAVVRPHDVGAPIQGVLALDARRVLLTESVNADPAPGYTLVDRLDPTGGRDPSFGDGGTAALPLAAAVVGATQTSTFAVGGSAGRLQAVRLRGDGGIDDTFGNIDLGPTPATDTPCFRFDPSEVVLGVRVSNPDTEDFEVVRFGETGAVLTPLKTPSSAAFLVCSVTPTSGLVVRAGSYDSVSSTGTTHVLTGPGVPVDVAVDTVGRVLLLGFVDTTGSVTRHDPAGNLDPTFRASFALDGVARLALAPDNGVIVVVTTSKNELRVMRLLP